MLILVETAEDVAILRIASRDLTLHDQHIFTRTLETFLSTHSNILLDMDEVQTVDGYTIATLLRALNQLKQRGGNLKLMNVHEPVLDFFEIARVHRVFEFHRSLQEAMASFRHDGRSLHSEAMPIWQAVPGVAD